MLDGPSNAPGLGREDGLVTVHRGSRQRLSQMNDRHFGLGNHSRGQNSAYRLLGRVFFFSSSPPTHTRSLPMFASDWFQLEFLCPAKQAEEIGAALIGAGSLGVEERPHLHEDASPNKSETPPNQTTSPVAWAQGDKGGTRTPSQCVLLIAYFSSGLTQEEQQKLLEIPKQWGITLTKSAWSLHKDDGWSTKWMEFFHPLPVGRRLVICPTWEEFAPEPQQRVLRLDPGMAFGTGHHATTRSCLLLLEEFLAEASVMLDVGCGSGILSLAAVLLGLPRAEGIDIDADAIQVAYENAELNGLSESVTFSTTPLARVTKTYPLVVANIQAHILIPMAPSLRKCTQPGGTLLLSGVLTEHAKDVWKTFQGEGFSLLRHHRDEEWSTLAFRFPSQS